MCRHHVEANSTVSPVTGSSVIVLTQYDVSRYVNAELEVKSQHVIVLTQYDVSRYVHAELDVKAASAHIVSGVR
eukprot:1134435-Pelagomonas_calceolata.AAC.1